MPTTDEEKIVLIRNLVANYLDGLITSQELADKVVIIITTEPTND